MQVNALFPNRSHCLVHLAANQGHSLLEIRRVPVAGYLVVQRKSLQVNLFKRVENRARNRVVHIHGGRLVRRIHLRKNLPPRIGMAAQHPRPYVGCVPTSPKKLSGKSRECISKLAHTFSVLDCPLDYREFHPKLPSRVHIAPWLRKISDTRRSGGSSRSLRSSTPVRCRSTAEKLARLLSPADAHEILQSRAATFPSRMAGPLPRRDDDRRARRWPQPPMRQMSFPSLLHQPEQHRDGS